MGDELDISQIMQTEGIGGDIAPDTTPAPTETPAESTPAAAATPQEWEVPWNGQSVKAPQDQVIKWASMGYDYSQKMQAFNQEREAFNSQKSQYDEKYSRYSEIDQFASQNPEWWEHVEQSWQNREMQQLAPELQEAIKPYLKELNAVKQFQNEWHKEKLAQQQQHEDAQLDQQIGEIRKQYTDVNFDATDENGQSLEFRILAHANANGLPTFKAAFLDYYHDNLAKIYEGRGRKAVETEYQKRKSLGLLGETPAPASQIGAQQRAPVSYEQGLQMALQEYGLS